MLADVAEQIAPVRLEFAKAGLNHMSLPGVVEMLTASADPLLGFEQEVRELRADLLRQVLQQGHAKKQVNLNILFVLGLLKSRVQKIGKLAFPRRSFGRARSLPVGFPARGLPAIHLQTVSL